MVDKVIPVATVDDFIPRPSVKSAGVGSPNDVADAFIKVLGHPAAKPLVEGAGAFLSTMAARMQQVDAAKRAKQQPAQIPEHNPVLFE